MPLSIKIIYNQNVIYIKYFQEIFRYYIHFTLVFILKKKTFVQVVEKKKFHLIHLIFPLHNLVLPFYFFHTNFTGKRTHTFDATQSFCTEYKFVLTLPQLIPFIYKNALKDFRAFLFTYSPWRGENKNIYEHLRQQFIYCCNSSGGNKSPHWEHVFAFWQPGILFIWFTYVFKRYVYRRRNTLKV